MAEKPVCRKCGEQHWKFVRCIEAPHENALDEQRAAQAARLRVIPQPRTHTQRSPLVMSRNFVEQAPGVYRRRRNRG